MRSVEVDLRQLAREAQEAQASLSRLPWLQFLPAVSDWQRSAQHLLSAGRWAALGGAELAAAMTPQQEQIFRSSGARGRLEALAEALERSKPQLLEAASLWTRAGEEIAAVDPDSLPSSLFGLPVRARARDAVQGIEHASMAAPWLPHLPSLLGGEGSRRYLLLFQDSGEVRATGGFLAAFALLDVSDGQITLTPSRDIYDLPRYGCPDSPLPGEALRLADAAGPDAGTFRVFTSQVWRYGIPVQDSNWWPDLERSMGLFLCHYEGSGEPPVDGVVLVDMTFLVGLLEEVGPVKVEGYSQPFSSEPVTYFGIDIPQAVYQILLYSERLHVGRPDRKRVVSDLSRALLERLYDMPAPRIRQIGGRALELAREGHLLVYFPTEELQRLVDRSPLARKIATADGDYLYLVEANYAGCKCDLFVERQVEQKAVEHEGTVRRTVTITYRNPAPPDRWLVKEGGTYVVRAYVPHGSRLVSSSGQAGAPVIYDDSGATVFAFLVTMPAPGSVELSFSYDLPAQLGRELLQNGYALLIQRQPGLPPVRHTLSVMGRQEEIVVRETARLWREDP